MQLRSNAFANGSTIPRRYTCDGEDLSPPLEWSDPPAETCSFVLLCDDPDAPGGTWHHWAAYNIPHDRTSLAQNAAQKSAELGFKQAINDFQKTGYGGPCPPHRHGLHHYQFRLLALSIEYLTTSINPTCRDITREARKHVLAEATLVGLYERS